MRAKFAGPCIPDPTVSHILITDDWLRQMAAKLPEMPNQKVKRFVQQYGLMYDEAVQMSVEREVSEYFETVVELGASPRTAANWIVAQLLPATKEHGYEFSTSPVTARRLADVISMLEKNEINSSSAKSVLARLFETDQSPEEIVDQFGFRQISDIKDLSLIVDQVISENASAVENYKNGNKKSIGFLIGQAMNVSKGKANPKFLQEILREKLT